MKTNMSISNDNNICDVCGGAIVLNDKSRELVCSACGLVFEDSSHSFDDGLIRSRDKGNDGFIRTNEPGAFSGTGFNPHESSMKNKRSFQRMKKWSDRINIVHSSSKLKNIKKSYNILEEAELVFRNMNVPSHLKSKMINLFAKVANELKFSDSRATLFAGAFVWWFVNYHTITNITIHSITSNITNLDDTAVKERITDNATRIVASKVNIAKRMYGERKLETTVMKALIQLTENETFDNVPGIEHIKEIVECDLSRSDIINRFDRCLDEIDKEKREINNTGERISRYARIIENTKVIKKYMADADVEDPDLATHIKKNITVMSKSSDFTDKQIALLEKTCLKIADNISRTSISGMSRHTMASVIIWIGLLYHGKRMNMAQIADTLNSSKSTLGVRTRKWEKRLGFKKCEACRDHGYLKATKKGSILHDLGVSIKFDVEPKNDVLRDLITGLIDITQSSKSAEYVAARFTLIQMLINNGRMSDKNIIEALRNDHFKDAVGSQRHIRWNARMRNKECISSSTEIVCRDGDYLYISPRFSECIDDAFKPVYQYIQLCEGKRFDRDRCGSSLSILKSRLERDLESIPDKPDISEMNEHNDSELNALIITMRLDNRSYGDIKKKIHEKFPSEDRDLRNYIYKIWSRYQEEKKDR